MTEMGDRRLSLNEICKYFGFGSDSVKVDYPKLGAALKKILGLSIKET